jgi:hypothetical protein
VINRDLHKDISKEIEEIKNFGKEETFTILSDNSLVNDLSITLNKDVDRKVINFEMPTNFSIFYQDLTFKKIGFDQEIKIFSQTKHYIIPSLGITSLTSSFFTDIKNLKGEISTVHSENFPIEKREFFRLVLKSNKEYSITKFLGSRYTCAEVHYSLGLTIINVENVEYHLFRHSQRTENSHYLVIECHNKTNFDSFKNVCESILKSIGFLTGNWYQNEHYFFSYLSVAFDNPIGIYYTYFGDSIVTNFEITNPQQFRSYIEDENNKQLLSPLLFPETTLSNLISLINSKPELDRAIELVLEGNDIGSPLIRCSTFSVALETVVSLISSENKTFFKPLKQTEKVKAAIASLRTALKNSKQNLTNEEYSFLEKKLIHINTSTNKDKFLRAFKLYNIDLPKSLLEVLNTRNYFFHGKTPYEEGMLKSNLKELHLEADRIHLITAILILKYSGYRGHVKNQAGYRIQLNKMAKELDDKIDESAFYRI